MGRNVAVLLGYDQLPGRRDHAGTARRHRQTTRMAFHAIKAGEGDVYLSAGVEAVSRFGKGTSDQIDGRELGNPTFTSAIARTAKRTSIAAETWCDPRDDGDLPDVYAAMGQTAENVQQVLGMGRDQQDEFAVRSQNLTEKAIADGFWQRDITPVVRPDGTMIVADDCPRPGVTLEAVSTLKPAFRPDGTVTAGNACPLSDGRPHWWS